MQMRAIINKSHAHDNDVKTVENKQNCALSEKGTWIARENIEDAGNTRKNKRNKLEVYPRLLHKLELLKFGKTAPKI